MKKSAVLADVRFHRFGFIREIVDSAALIWKRFRFINEKRKAAESTFGLIREKRNFLTVFALIVRYDDKAAESTFGFIREIVDSAALISNRFRFLRGKQNGKNCT